MKIFAPKPAKFVALAFVCWPLMLCAAPPTTEPVDTGTASADIDPGGELTPTPGPGFSGNVDNNHPRRFGEGQGPPGRGRMIQRMMGVSPRDVDDAMAFFKDHSPNRFTAIQSLPDNERKAGFKAVAASMYLGWKRLQNDDPQLYSVIVKRVELEDTVFGLVAKLRKNTSAGNASGGALSDDDTAAKAQLHEAVGKLVDIGLDERKLRLARLQKTVEEQQKKLTDDTANRERLVEDRLKNIVNMDKGLLPGGPNSSGHGPGGGLNSGRGRGGSRPSD